MKTTIKTTAIGAAAVFLLAVAINSMTVSIAKATPQLAQGKACNACHTGAPPSKANVKK